MTTAYKVQNFARASHVSHLIRCITGLPSSKLDLDTSRLALAYYCLSALDILRVLDDEKKVSSTDRADWRDWIWSLSVRGEYGFGFGPGYSLNLPSGADTHSAHYNPPHLIMTYTALLSLSILRDEFSRLDRPGLLTFLRSTQHPDGSFSPLPIDTISSERDLRLTFCNFSICSMLNDWSAIDVEKAIDFIARCRTYEGGYGESPGREAQGGPTYCALASLRLYSEHKALSSPNVPPHPQPFLSPSEATQTLRWLTQRQKGGFQGRTEKKVDACYCFWCGASIKLLDGDGYVDSDANATFLLSCQYKYGGIAKEPGETPDPYHTYLSLASMALYPPTEAWLEHNSLDKSAWTLDVLDPVLNLRVESADWLKKHVPN